MIGRVAGLAVVCCLVLVGCRAPGTHEEPRVSPTGFPNALDLTGTPASADDRTVFAFSDQGAWHMFGLASQELGGFAGPLLLTDRGRWIGPSLVSIAVELPRGDRVVWSRPADGSAPVAYPGRLHDHLIGPDGLEAELDLVFATDRTAVVRARVHNGGASPVRLRAGWRGDAGYTGRAVGHAPGEVVIGVAGSGAVVHLRFSDAGLTPTPAPEPDARYSALGATRELAPGQSLEQRVLVSAYFDRAEMRDDRPRRRRLLEGEPFADAEARWGDYLTRALSPLAGAPEPHRRLAVKAVETLISNWRGPAGSLRHDGLFPSYAYRGFHGVWAWDSWKHARALARFAPELAREQVRVMLARQNERGMIPDVIYADSVEDNWRDTKPPLAAWAVHEIFQRNADTSFVAEVYPALTAYHAWWYADRDHDGNGLAEYGSTDGTRIAAAWESGMDNAVRFDSAAMLSNGLAAWSMDQESVDLNSYLYAEKLYLAELAGAIGRDQEAASFRSEAEGLGAAIRSRMWSEETAYFHDIRLPGGQIVSVQGPEGWIPLWAGVATREQAARVARVMMDPARFNGVVPLPTLAMDRPEFDPTDGYWRGPVWLDQAYFGVAGLRRYGLTAEARVLRDKLVSAPAGLLGTAPIYENYDPRTGAGLNAPHFSWSAAHLLMLLWEG